MATRLYAFNPGDLTVQEGVGAATSSRIINLTVDLAANTVNEGSGTRVISREEVFLALERLKRHIMENNWPIV